MELNGVEGIPPLLARLLASRAITRPEQLVAAGSRPGGISCIAALLQLSQEDVEALIAAARAVLAPDVVEAMEQPVRTDRRMGLLVDEERSRSDEPAERS